jgi:hypothetical protein
MRSTIYDDVYQDPRLRPNFVAAPTTKKAAFRPLFRNPVRGWRQLA